MKSIIQKTLLLFLIGGAITSCSCLKDCSEPSGAISEAKATTMQTDYTANQHLFINAGLSENYPGSGEDNREIWFSIEEIEQYICFAKKESIIKGFTLSGLRVYLASKRIPDGTTKIITDSIPRTTVFFVPTHFETNPIIRGYIEDNGANNKDTNGIKPLNMGDSGNGTYGAGG